MARKLAFQKEEVLQKAMQVFWKKGYESSSMEDLVKAMEINRFSIYNSFGDKKALLIQSLELYRDTVFASILAPLQQKRSARDCLIAYFDTMSALLSAPSGSLGCLVQRTSHSEIASDPQVGRVLYSMLSDLKSALMRVVENAIKEESLRGEQAPEQIVDFILSQIQGLILLRRFDKSLVSTDQQIQLLKEAVLRW